MTAERESGKNPYTSPRYVVLPSGSSWKYSYLPTRECKDITDSSLTADNTKVLPASFSREKPLSAAERAPPETRYFIASVILCGSTLELV